MGGSPNTVCVRERERVREQISCMSCDSYIMFVPPMQCGNGSELHRSLLQLLVPVTTVAVGGENLLDLRLDLREQVHGDNQSSHGHGME